MEVEGGLVREKHGKNLDGYVDRPSYVFVKNKKERERS